MWPARDSPNAVEGRCIVVHDDKKKRVGIGKIVCPSRPPSATSNSCKATIGPYPTGEPAPATTTTTTMSTQMTTQMTTTSVEQTTPSVDAAGHLLMSASALALCSILSF